MNELKKILFIFAFSIAAADCCSQLPDHNTYLLANLDNYPAYSGLWGYVAPDGSEYALLGCSNGTSVVNITDSTNITEIGFIPGANSGWREIKTYSHYAYVVSEGTNSRLQIIDLQYLPDSVNLVNTWNYSGYTQTHAISQSGPYLYLSGGNAAPNGGVQIVDITDPVLPVRRGNNTVRYIHDCRIEDDTVWAFNINNQKVSIINAADKDNVQEIRNFNTIQAMPHSSAFTNDRKFLFLTFENHNPGKLEIWNVQDLENITYVRNWQPTAITTSVIHNIEIYDNYAIAAHYTAGIRILDISDPVNPVEVAWYDTRPQDNSSNFEGCWSVHKFPSGKIIGSDITNGLFVIRMSVPTGIGNVQNNIANNYSLSQNYPNPFNPETVIQYEISSGNKLSDVRLVVYDALGKEVATLVNSKQKTGKFTVKFNGKDLASGIYFYKLETNDFQKVLKMTLIK